MSLFWPFSFFNYVVERYVSMLDAPLPSFAVSLRYTILITSATVTVLIPGFWFLTIINGNSHDSFMVRVFWSGVHSVWWSFVLCFVGSGLLVLLLGLPAFTADMCNLFGLLTIGSICLGGVVSTLLVSRLRSGSKEPARTLKRKKRIVQAVN